MAVHRITFHKGSDGSMVQTGHTVDKFSPPAPNLSNDVDWSVAGLGAYRAYRSHPGKFFPSRGLTCNIDRNPRPDRGRQSARVITKL